MTRSHRREPLFVVEARDADGKLLLGDYPQPHSVLGDTAITGITLDDLASEIFRRDANVELYGTNVGDWARVLDSNWVVRERTW